MPLLIKFIDDKTGYIPTCELNNLLAAGKIKAFKRSRGEWVDPKVGPIRGQGLVKPYSGPNRRSRW